MILHSMLRYRLQNLNIALIHRLSYGTNSTNDYPYSSEEQQKILQKLNEADVEELSRLKISPVRLARLNRHRQQLGTFSSLDDVSKASGMGPGPMERFCNSILYSSPSEKKVGKKLQLVKPQLANSVRDRVKDVVGIHLLPEVITWTKVTREGNVLDWNLQHLDPGLKKLHPLNLLEAAIIAIQKLPVGEIYVMEEPANYTQLAKNLLHSLQTSQLRAMLLAFLSTDLLDSNEALRTASKSPRGGLMNGLQRWQLAEKPLSLDRPILPSFGNATHYTVIAQEEVCNKHQKCSS